MLGVSQKSPIPKYRQLADLLRAEIVGGVLVPGDQLPSEAQLQDAHGISRITIRQALADLEREGLLTKVPGKGTYVQKRAHHVDRVTRLTGFGENVVALGMEPGYRVLRAEPAPIPADVAFRLQIPPSKGFVVERVLLADGEPVATHTSYLPPWVVRQVGPEPLSAESLGQGSLYRILEAAGVRMQRADEIVEPALAGAAEARTLGMAAGELVLRVTRTVFDPNGAAIEHVLLIYNAAVYTYRTTLVR